VGLEKPQDEIARKTVDSSCDESPQGRYHLNQYVLSRIPEANYLDLQQNHGCERSLQWFLCKDFLQDDWHHGGQFQFISSRTRRKSQYLMAQTNTKDWFSTNKISHVVNGVLHCRWIAWTIGKEYSIRFICKTLSAGKLAGTQYIASLSNSFSNVV
jgi:hypothetical protein